MKETFRIFNRQHELIGFAFVSQSYIQQIYVQPEYRGKGDGVRLLKNICVEADRCCATLYVKFEPSPEIDEKRIIKFFRTYDFVWDDNQTDVLVRRWKRAR